MRKAIVVGSNNGYGVSISKALHDKGFYIIGLSRKENTGLPIDVFLPITDVSNVTSFSNEFGDAIGLHSDCDTAVFVPGDVVLKKQDDYTEDDLKYTLDVNLRYIVEGVKKLREGGKIKNVVTFGSQWSYTENDKILAAYSIAKHLLKRFTFLLNEQGINAFHFCVPTSKTEKASNISTFLTGAKQKLPLEKIGWADPDDIAQTIVNEILSSSSENHLYRFERENDNCWSLATIDIGSDGIDKRIRELKLEDFYEGDDLYKIARELYIDLAKREFVENKEVSIEFRRKNI